MSNHVSYTKISFTYNNTRIQAHKIKRKSQHKPCKKELASQKLRTFAIAKHVCFEISNHQKGFEITQIGIISHPQNILNLIHT
jgi:hypothetical protein